MTKLKSAYDGYGYFSDGSNPQNRNALLVSSPTIYKMKDEVLTLPYNIGTDLSVQFTAMGTTTTFDSSDATNNSSNIIGYYDTNSLAYDKILYSNDGNSNTYRVDVVEIEECRNTPYKITFVNKFGALEDIWFYGASKEITSTSKEDYKSNIVSAGSYSINEHQRKILNKNGVDSMVINSNFYPEEHNETFKQLFLSEKVWITYKTQVLPIQITSNSISFKNRLNDKLINYEINIEFSNNNINNIR